MNWCQELSGEKGMTFSRHKIFPNYAQKQHLDKSLLSMQPEEISVRLNKSLCKQRLFFTVMSKACCLFICVCSQIQLHVWGYMYLYVHCFLHVTNKVYVPAQCVIWRVLFMPLLIFFQFFWLYRIQKKKIDYVLMIFYIGFKTFC